MKCRVKTALIGVSLLLSAGMGFAADVKAPVTGMKGVATSAGGGVNADAKAAGTAAKESAQGKAADVKSSAKSKLVDINTATEAELKAIPGIGDAYAAKIIAGRPYANKAQLKSRNIIPTNVYEQVKEMIIAKAIKK